MKKPFLRSENSFEEALSKRFTTHRSSACIGCSDVTRSVEMSEILVRRFAVARRELVREGLGADSVNGARESISQNVNIAEIRQLEKC